MAFAYSSPAAFRAWDDPADLAVGEVFFDHAPSAGELAAAFPNFVDTGAIITACDQIVATILSHNGRNQRGSMNTWAAAVALQTSTRSSDDATCAQMVPLINTWEGAMYAARDQAIGAGTALANITWPSPPDGTTAFVASCDQG